MYPRASNCHSLPNLYSNCPFGLAVGIFLYSYISIHGFLRMHRSSCIPILYIMTVKWYCDGIVDTRSYRCTIRICRSCTNISLRGYVLLRETQFNGRAFLTSKTHVRKVSQLDAGSRSIDIKGTFRLNTEWSPLSLRPRTKLLAHHPPLNRTPVGYFYSHHKHDELHHILFFASLFQNQAFPATSHLFSIH